MTVACWCEKWRLRLNFVDKLCFDKRFVVSLTIGFWWEMSFFQQSWSLALALASKILALASKRTGLGLEDYWPWPWTCCPRTIPGFFAVKFLRSQINRVWVVSFARWRNYFAELIKIKLTDVFGTKYSKNHANGVGGRFNLQLWANGSLVFLGHRVYDAQTSVQFH